MPQGTYTQRKLHITKKANMNRWINLYPEAALLIAGDFHVRAGAADEAV